MSGKHIPTETWLATLDLREYTKLFHKYSGVEALLFLTEREIFDLGVKDTSHRARIVSSLVVLREKLHRKSKSRQSSPVHRSYSVASPQPVLNHQDYASLRNNHTNFHQDIAAMETTVLLSQVWFHGNIPRQKAEKLVSEDGDFLVRASVSQPGEYVLTCFWRGSSLHFVVNKTIRDMHGPYPRIQYLFEDEMFDSVVHLVQFHLKTQKPISGASMAIINNPIVRTAPLACYGNKGLQNAMSGYNTPTYSPVQSPSISPRPSPFTSPMASPVSSPPVLRRVHHQRSGSQPITLLDSEQSGVRINLERHGSVPMIAHLAVANQNPVYNSQSEPMYQQLPSRCTPAGNLTLANQTPSIDNQSESTYQHLRSGSAPVAMAMYENRASLGKVNGSKPLSKPSSSASDQGRPPPKPSRIPSVKYTHKPVVKIRNKALYDDDGKDYADYGQVKSFPADLIPTKESPAEKNTVKHRKNQKPTTKEVREGYDDDYDNDFESAQVRKQLSRLTKSPKQGRTSKTESKEIRVGYDDDYDNDMDAAQVLQHIPSKVSDVKEGDDATEKNSAESKIYGNATSMQDTENIYDCPSKEARPLTPETEKSFVIPDLDNLITAFAPLEYKSRILTVENKPLDSLTVAKVKNLMLGAKPRCLAEHLTKLDIALVKVVNKQEDLGLGVFSGLELITLPHGQKLREDILERFHCLKFFIGITILTCQKLVERSHMVHQWIQVAMEMKGTLGNLFGLSYIMEGLQLMEVTRMKNTWSFLRQDQTNSYYVFEAKLRPLIKSLSEGSGSLPLQNICIPHIIPLINLLNRDFEDILNLQPWEDVKPDFAIDILLAHLDTARIITAQSKLYQVKAESIVNTMVQDNDILEMFRTEFHIRLLWGMKGAGVSQRERFIKFTQLVRALSERAEPSQTLAQETEL